MSEESMTFRTFAGILFAVLGILILAGRAEAQCMGGLDFTYCPSVDTMYLHNEKYLGALTVSENKIKWQTELPHEIEEDFNGPVATAENVVIYAGAPLTRIRAFNAVTGKPSWRIETSSGDVVSAGPYFLYADITHWEGINAVDGRTGKIVWHHGGRKPGDIQFYALSKRVSLTNIFAIDANTGQVMKRWPKDWDISAATFAGPFIAIGTRYGGLEHYKLAIYSRSPYQMLWSRRDTTWKKSDPQERLIAGVAGDATNLLAATYEDEPSHPGHATLECISTASGKTIWSKDITANYMLLSSPVALSQGLAIFVMADSRNTSVVEAFDASTGEQKWIIHTDRRLTDGPVCDDRHCYMGAISHEVLAIDVQSGAQSWFSLQ